MKKIRLFLTFVFVLVVSLLSSCDMYDDTEGLLYHKYGDSYAVSVGDAKDEKNIVIRSYKDLNVTGINHRAFFKCSSLESILIPESVTWIGNDAFYYCFSLTNVYYTGTKAQWINISIGTGNEELYEATIHYNYVPKK